METDRGDISAGRGIPRDGEKMQSGVRLSARAAYEFDLGDQPIFLTVEEAENLISLHPNFTEDFQSAIELAQQLEAMIFK